MSYQRFKQKVLVPLLVMPAVIGAGSLLAQEIDTSILDDARAIAERAFESARQSQQRVVALSDEADELLDEYRSAAKIVDSLEIYNAGMRRTIAQQETRIAEFDASIADAAELQRQIPPLMERMMVALERFVELDVPFQTEQRERRLADIRASFSEPNVNVAEKFRLVLAAYQQESNYGRDISSYTATLEIEGVERDVDVLRVGRIALLYQTSDQTTTGMWNRENQRWEVLDSSYRRPVRDAIRMARSEASIDIIELPIAAPESAQ